MKLSDEDIKFYRKAIKRTRGELFISIGYIPIFVVWIFMINFYDWPRLEIPMATALLFIFCGPLYRTYYSSQLVALLKKFGAEHPELEGSTDEEPI